MHELDNFRKEGQLFADKYELVDLLGRGAFSEVWLAVDSRTHQEVAIKVYAPDTGLDSEGVKMFTEEFSIVTGLNHTNLLRPTYFDDWKNIPYLILPYCKNGSAFKYLRLENEFSEEEWWKMLCDVSSGLAYLHAKNPPVIHQDIKPDNILINDEGRYMITDFGISKRIRRTMTMRANKQADEIGGGTRAYMGPERFGPNPSPIMANDIWSLGAMLFELMTGDAPFGDDGGLLQMKGAMIPEITNENYSEELKQIVRLCLSPNTYERPTACYLANYADMRLKGFSPEDVIGKQNNTFTNSLRTTLFPAKASTQGRKWNLKLILSALAVIAVIGIAVSVFAFHSDRDEVAVGKTEEPLEQIAKPEQSVKSEEDEPASAVETEDNTKEEAIINNNINKEEKIRKPQTPTYTEHNVNTESVHQSKPARGILHLQNAIYNGEILDGQPHGNGEMRFTGTRNFNSANGILQVHEGYVLKGRFNKDRLEQGYLYDENGTKKQTIF